MKIGIIGATGNVGRVIFKEARTRGHEATAIVRNAAKAKQMLGNDIDVLEKDALALTKTDLSDFDAIVNASALQPAYLNLDLATKLVSLFRDNDHTQLVFISGASSLVGDDGSFQIDNILKTFAGQPWIETPLQQVHELQFLQWIDNVKWTVMTPQNDFVAGDKTKFRLGTNKIMTDKSGKSQVSFGNFAAALLDELKAPKHVHQQFTVVDD
ncbi:Rrf2-linked NADH-flavin reductase [Pediococcus damnosus]|uniref:Rrf2-linked NADH-flavin reductase n=1 Tax=Pediococcus damnosus TaxID=51663 RepID=A0A0R2HT35_9LACO|nr:NAD(P)H-binding protein [Pediococcus damnosus]AMV61967.1 Rrf2-linked NADH-flavin reductase [Pediococcus damnosus]AMV66153.1 Rrf2-linked NADH-flavin reductase [Pediococcus damnosus]AMV68438.1 Rrf2-linked NADH-flavin reductase [Pediococcus damnosus]KJU74319.1 NADH-flavin reductase [Pediococcus damnosus LMG 28219]KRN52749.1 NAD-dependent epimerase dehydratase [Pediococcus damnosus]